MYELLVPKGASNSSSCNSWTYGSGKHLRSSSPVNIGLTYPFGSNFWYLLCLSGSSKIISKCNIHLLTQLYTCTNRQIHTTQFKNHYHTLCVRQTDTHTHTISLAWSISPNSLAPTYFDNFNPNHTPFLKLYTLASLGCLHFSETHLQASVSLSALVLSLEATLPFTTAKKIPRLS